MNTEQNLIKDLVALMSPALPYLVSAGQEISREVGKGVGKTVLKNARKVWNILSSDIGLKSPALEEAIQDVVKRPEDEDAQASLKLQLTKLLENNPTLAEKLADMMEKSEEVTTTITQTAGDNSVQVGQARDVKIKR